MKKTILGGAIALFSLSSSALADGHDTMMVVWEGIPGYLETTIMADTTATGEQAHDVYVLESDKVYLQLSELNLNSSCAIVGAPYGDGEHPATIQPITGADGASQFTGWPNANIKTYGENQTYHFENLLFNGVFADESGAIFGVLCTYGEGNTIMVNEVTSVHNSVITYFNFGQAEKWHLTNNTAVQYTSYPGGMYFGGFFWGGGAWGGTLTELVIQNNTIEGAHGEGLVLWDNTILNPEAGGSHEDAVIDHNTFVNIINWPKFYRGGNNSHWTNNLMVNMVAGPQTHNSHGQGPSLNHPGGHGYMGTLSQSECADSTLLAQGRCWDNNNRDIHYNNNAWHVTSEMYSLQNDTEPWCWDVTDTNNVVTTYCDTMIGGIGSTFDYTQARWMDDSTAAQEVNGVTEENNIEVPDLGFNLDPIYTTTQITRTMDWLDNKVHDTHTDNVGWNYQADGNNIVVEWPLPLDFTYSTSSAAYTHGEDGFPAGDLNHFPDKLEEWEELQASGADVTFTITDHTWMIEDVMVKGSMSGWGVFQAYDDGTNGDAIAGDHVWTAQYATVNGDYQWGAIDTENEDGTICEACDGSDGWGTWLMEGHPNPEFSVVNGELTGVVDWVLPPDSAVSEGVVKFTVHDGTEEWTDLMWKGSPTDWAVVQMYDDGTNGDETAGDHVWTATVPAVMAGAHQWGAIDTDNGDGTECEACDGSDGYGTWLIEGDNPGFTLDEDMLTLHGQTDYEIIPAGGGDEITKTVLFNVDLTEWLDEEGNMGMRAFNIANGDEIQVRGSFNNWGNCTECTMTRTPGTNIFSHAIEVTALPDAELDFAYYMHLSEASLAAVAERFNAYDSDGNPAIVDWIGWETSPQFVGNRNFMLGEDDGTGLVELPEESFYDAFPGSVLPEGTIIEAIFSIDMSNVAAFNADEDSVYLRTHDKWLNLSQGFSDGSDINHYAGTAVGDGVYEFPVTLSGPVPWCIYYKWGWYDLSEATENDEAGGGLGGAPRIRYLHQDMDANCEWPATYRFPLDTEFLLEDNEAQEEWDPESICMVLMAVDGNAESTVPSIYSISDNYPNPFNPSTEMEFTLPMESDISFTVYSLTGKEVYSYSKSAISGGTYKITWNGKNHNGRSLPSGVYLYEFRAGNEFRQVKKMTLLK